MTASCTGDQRCVAGDGIFPRAQRSCLPCAIMLGMGTLGDRSRMGGSPRSVQHLCMRRRRLVWCCTVPCGAVQCGTTWCGAMPCSVAQWDAVQLVCVEALSWSIQAETAGIHTFLLTPLWWIHCLWGCQTCIWSSVFTDPVLLKCWSRTRFPG